MNLFEDILLKLEQDKVNSNKYSNLESIGISNITKTNDMIEFIKITKIDSNNWN